MNVQGAAVERRAGRAIMPRFHAGYSVGTVAGALARLHGGPSDGDLVQAPLTQWRVPVDVIGLPVPVLDEQSEMFWWDTANYFSAPLPTRWHPGDSCA
jgi:hypothetical protein